MLTIVFVMIIFKRIMLVNKNKKIYKKSYLTMLALSYIMLLKKEK